MDGWRFSFWRVLFLLASAVVAGCERRTGEPSPPPREVTFAADIAPLLHRRCASCHCPGGAAPFSLLTYDDARKRCQQIADVASSRFMPPWLPEQGEETFAAARKLTDREIELLERWAAQGAPLGDELLVAERAAPSVASSLGPPDLVLETPPIELPAVGGDVFRNFVLEVPISESRWVRAVELRPTNPRVTHHARLGVDASRESARRDAADPQPGYEGMAWGQDPEGQLITWTPGMTPDLGQTGAAWLLKPQASLVLHAHLTPTGKPEAAAFRIGLYFADEPPQVQPLIVRVGSRAIDIPPGAEGHTVEDVFELPTDVVIENIFPHAHSLCQRVEVVAELPDGAAKTLIRIPRFDEKWHDKYRFAEPLALPQGTRLRATFVYDNSANNPRNPHHPPRRVVYGSDARDEMADVYLQVVVSPPERRAVLLEAFEAAERRSKIVGYRTTHSARPEDPWVGEGLAAALLSDGSPGDALAALAGARNSAYSATLEGAARLALRDPKAAEADFRRAIELDPEYAAPWHGLGQTLAQQEKYADAEESLRRAVALDPEPMAAWLDLADLLIRGGRLEEAAGACEAAQRAAPDKAKPYLKLAEIRAHQRRYDDALSLLEAARRVAPYTYAPRVALAALCYQLGDEPHARSLLADAQRESPDDPVAHFYLGQIARRDGRLAEAKVDLAQAATLPTPTTWPDSHRRQFLRLVHAERLQLADETEDWDLARTAVSAWLELEPANRSLRELHERFSTPPPP